MNYLTAALSVLVIAAVCVWLDEHCPPVHWLLDRLLPEQPSDVRYVQDRHK